MTEPVLHDNGSPLRGADVRLAVVDDADALGMIQATSHRVTYRGVMPDSLLARIDAQRLAERFRARLSAATAGSALDEHRLWVVEVDGAVAGYAATQPGASTFLPPPNGAGEMESLYLHPDAMGRGLGGALHRHAIADLVARGFDPLVLWAFAANERARRFYEGAGWILDVAGEHWVLDGVPCSIVRYRLEKCRLEPRAAGTVSTADTPRASTRT